MLIKLHETLEGGEYPVITKTVNGENVSAMGAFSLGTTLCFSVKCSRKMGVHAVVLRIAKDGEAERDFPFDFYAMTGDEDEYRLEVCLDESFCVGEDGLFYYEFLLLRGMDTLFSQTDNNVDVSFDCRSDRKFRLLVYRSDFRVPSWFAGGTMYHVFVDRFFRGQGEVGAREDAILNEDWYGEIKQFAPYPGAPVPNNEFFGGNLWGVAEKLEYLASLGVTVIYLSPVFKAYSNHKYDTGDYMKVDEMFGGDQALEHLIEKARAFGMRLILDGVFNHTGDNSRYFNRYGQYDDVGAYQSASSPYHDWYCFDSFPDSYRSWWGIEILPKLNPSSESCRNFLAGKGGVAEHYIKKGIGGWRLDVADELSDTFLDRLRETVKAASSEDGIIIGEVWENAADKIAYGKRRRYFRGKQLDSVMNYPLKNAILAFVKFGDAQFFYDGLTELYSSYPKDVCDSLMNLLGTHDTERILSVLGDEEIEMLDNAELATRRMTDDERRHAISKLKIASALQYTVFGVPSVFYGDECGIEGGHDPFCRRPYPWGREQKELLEHYRRLGKIRREHPVFKSGAFSFLSVRDGFVAYERSSSDERIVVAANCGEWEEILALNKASRDLLTDTVFENAVPIAPGAVRILLV